MFFTSLGKVYYLKVHELPETSRHAKGVHIKTLLEIAADEDVASVVALKDFDKEIFVFLATASGQVAKIRSSSFIHAKKRGIRAMKLLENDHLVAAFLTNGSTRVFLASRKGQGLRLNEEEVRPMGRGVQGVRGINLKKNDEVAGATIAPDDYQALFITERGHGKRVQFSQFMPHGRGTGGSRAYSVVEETGEVAAILSLTGDEEFVAITSQGLTIRQKSSGVSLQGRTSRGVRVINISAPDFVVGAAPILEEEAD